MKCEYEIENVFPVLSLEQIKEIMCWKIARLIIYEENK